jgi:hypothetical protein
LALIARTVAPGFANSAVGVAVTLIGLAPLLIALVMGMGVEYNAKNRRWGDAAISCLIAGVCVALASFVIYTAWSLSPGDW